jgi:nitrogen fixation/metabolism regulation signal transduction histidine kinase
VTKVRTRGNRVQITVIDNGCGLPKENRERLVEPYMTTRAKGTGLGLAIVQRITEQHGGTLTLADAPKRNGKVEGASVRIDFPMGEQEGAVKYSGAPGRGRGRGGRGSEPWRLTFWSSMTKPTSGN